MSDTQDGRQTNSIEDMLGMDVDEVTSDLDFDLSEEPLWTHDGNERGLAFAVIWDELGEYPPMIEDSVVDAILDDTDHTYRIEYPDQTREVSITGMALFALVDSDASVEVVE